MAEIVDHSQDFSSLYHVSSQQHMICSIDTQQERQFLGDQSKTIIDTNRSILLKSAVTVERQDMWLIHVIENMVFHISSSLKIIKQTVIILSRITKVQGQDTFSANRFYSWAVSNIAIPFTIV